MSYRPDALNPRGRWAVARAADQSLPPWRAGSVHGSSSCSGRRIRWDPGSTRRQLAPHRRRSARQVAGGRTAGARKQTQWVGAAGWGGGGRRAPVGAGGHAEVDHREELVRRVLQGARGVGGRSEGSHKRRAVRGDRGDPVLPEAPVLRDQIGQRPPLSEYSAPAIAILISTLPHPQRPATYCALDVAKPS
jgi:hypothetical protein